MFKKIQKTAVLFAALAMCIHAGLAGAADATPDGQAPTMNFLEASNIKRLEGYAQILGAAGACEVDVEPTFRRILMWTEINFQAGSNAAIEEHFFPMFLDSYASQRREPRENCQQVAEVFSTVIWP